MEISSSSSPPGLPEKHSRQTRWLSLIVLLFLVGLGLRGLTWQVTPAMRAVRSDMPDRWVFGQHAAKHGVIAVFDETAADLRAGVPPRYGRMDYMPLRLLAMDLWYQWTVWRYPDTREWRPELAFNAPLLAIGAVCELAAAILAAQIILRLGGRPGQAMLGAALLWLNPVVLVVGYGYPQWDSWTFPFYLGAILAVLQESRGRWFWAGLLLACGTLIKGQVALAAPVFLLVPLFRKQWKELGACLAGAAVGGVVGLAPWLLHGSFSPIEVGMLYGAEKFPTLARGYVQNLPMLARDYLGWATGQRLLGVVRVEAVFLTGYALLVVWTSWQASRRKDATSFVLAAIVPWLGIYVFMPRIITRYLVWPVAFMAVMAVINRRMAWVFVVLTAVGWTVAVLAKTVQPGNPALAFGRALTVISPWAAFVILACLGVMLWELRRKARSAEQAAPTSAATPGSQP